MKTRFSQPYQANPNSKWQIKTSAAIFLLSSLISAASWAGEGRHWSSAAAVAACQGKSIGDEVEFTNRQGKMVPAICREGRGEQLLAIPADRGMLARMVKRLGLSSDQQQKIETILESERATGKPIRQQLAAGREQMKAIVKAEPFDEAAVRTLATSQEAIRVELTVARARTRSQIYELLTPAQRDSAENWLSGAGRGHRGHQFTPEAD